MYNTIHTYIYDKLVMGSGMGKRMDEAGREKQPYNYNIIHIRTWLYRHSLQYHNYHTSAARVL